MPRRPAFFNKERYVTLCQQLLVTATVTAVTLTAAGVVTLDIVAPPSDAGTRFSGDLAPAVDVHPSYVDHKPVTPKVREVTVGTQAGAETQADARTVAPADASPRSSTRPDPATTQTVHGLPVALTSSPEKVSGYGTVGVTWQPGTEPAEDEIAFQVRTRANGAWSPWQKLQYHDDHGPDASDAADTAHARPGTDALVVGRVEQVQMRVAAANRKVPAGLQLALIDPGKDDLTREDPAIDTARLPDSDASATDAPIEDTGSRPAAPVAAAEGTAGSPGPGDTVALSAMKVAPKPQIFSRAQWGANEKIREKGLPNYGTIKTGFVHHTVNANDYHKRDVPALIRGIYAYHVISRGWRDIGYNFLVDRFGRIWEGRYGGVDRPVVGAHTLGFNEVSFAMSAIGNFDIAKPPKVVLDAYARLFAWKLSKYNIRADATGVQVKGRTLNAINGHRDVGQTACPGRYLYAQLPYIRTEAARIQRTEGGASSPTPTPSPQPDPTDYNPLAPAAVAPPQPAITFPRVSSVTGDPNRPDLVVQKPNGQVFVLRTGGMVGYQPPVTSSGNWGRMAKIVAVGDLTGDHRGDVMAKVRRTRNWLLFRGDGAGHVSSSPVDANNRLRNLSQVIAAGDWNRDGRDDLLGVDRRNNALYLYLRARGVGVFQQRQLIARNWGRFTKTVVVGDLNHDKLKDVATFDKNHALYVALGTASGALRAPVRQRALGRAYNGLTAGGDLTGDGVGDVLVRQRSGGAALILTGNGRGGFTADPFGPFPGMGGMSQLSAAQLTSGGRPDVLGRVGGRLQVRANNNLVNLRKPLYANLTTTPTTAIYAVGDWNADGYPDLVSRQGDGDRLILHRGLGHGQFAPGILMSRNWKSLDQLTAVGDVTGDGHPDLMGKKKTGVLRIFPGDGKAGFLPPLKAARLMRTFNQVGTGSWNPADTPDSMIGSSDGSFVPLAGVTPQLRTAAVGFARQYDWLIGLGDVNGDGLPDLLGRQRSDGTLWLIPGTATGFGPRLFAGSGLGKYRLVG